MAKLELSEETKAGMEQVGQADQLIAVATPVQADQLRAAAAKAVLVPSLSSLRTVVAFPGLNGTEAAALEPTEPATGLRFLPYSLPSGDPSRIPWLAGAGIYQGLFAMARELGVSACAVIGFDLDALSKSRSVSTEYASFTLPFVTDRRRDNDNFTSSSATELSYGAVTITIPQTHRVGEIEEPTVFRLRFNANPEKHFHTF